MDSKLLKVYSVSKFNSKVSVIEILSVTKLPKGVECYELANYGFVIFSKGKTVDKGNSILCLGIGPLKMLLREDAPWVKSIKEQIDKYEKYAVELRGRLNEVDSRKEINAAFIQSELEKYINKMKSNV